MKFRLLLFILIFGHDLSAQIFIEHPLTSPFEGLRSGSIAHSDVDDDGDNDVLITGINILNEKETKLYLNNGQGNFVEKPGTPFEGVHESSTVFLDIDGDSDEDLLIAGSVNSNTRIAKIYRNDGQGNFTEITNTPFLGVKEGSVAFADVDGDQDNDLLITGASESSGRISKLYINDGLGNYTEKTGTPFEPVSISYVTFLDIDGDNDKDIIANGQNASWDWTSKIYLNDGQGNFSESINSPISENRILSIDYSDLDGDQDNDLVILESTGLATFLVIRVNDGLGGFTEEINIPYGDYLPQSIKLSDVDGDQDFDILLLGTSYVNPAPTSISKIFQNNGQAQFTELPDIPFRGFSFFGSFDFIDIDGDDIQDFLIASDINGVPDSKLYLNDGNGNFINPYIPFFGVGNSSSVFSDIDNDGDEDVLITGFNTGLNSNIIRSTKLYKNDGEGNFTEKLDNPFDGVSLSKSAFADIDGDNDQDLLITHSGLYTNDGEGNFTKVGNTPFSEVTSGAVAFSDVDGDDDLDLMIAGRNNNFARITKLYINDSQGNFTEMMNTPFTGVSNGSIAFTDVDGDNDNDVMITGYEGTQQSRITELYINDGEGNFTEVTNTTFDQVALSSIAFSDVDGDGDKDVLITGSNNSQIAVSKLYLNDGSGIFTQMTGTTFEPVSDSDIAFSDIDGDGDDDILITGVRGTQNKISSLYINDGQGNFTVLTNATFDGISSGSIAFSDIDNDNDMDLLITGNNNLGINISKLYLNQVSAISNDISGLSFYDLNENQVKDANETVLNNQIVKISPNSYFSYTTNDGRFRFFAENGNYQVAAIPTENWQLTTDSILDINLQGQSISNIDFGFIPLAEIKLLKPDISSGATRCSFDVPFWLSYQNNGTTFENGFLEFSLSQGAILQEVSVTPDEIDGNNLRWNYTNFAPSQLEKIRLILKMPDASNLGDTLNFVATTYLIDDNQDTIQNTIYNYNPILNCAYDPNDKAAIPAGVGEDNLTLFDSEFEYRIRFQNTGTDTAFTVRIEDDLDPNLDWNTFRPISASHPYEVDMDLTSGRVTFLFRNILLPDSIVNEPLSHGFVKYKISPLENLSEETPITNEASIFFDFNEPILTNMTLNTMVSMLTNTNEVLQSTELTVIPNPFQNSTIFRIKEIPRNRGTLNIYDTNGVLIFSESVISNVDITFRKEDLASGIYFYEVVSDQNVRVFNGRVLKY